jgi:hypothetical protein
MLYGLGVEQRSDTALALASYYRSISILGTLLSDDHTVSLQDGAWPLRVRFVQLYIRLEYSIQVPVTKIKSRLRCMKRNDVPGIHPASDPTSAMVSIPPNISSKDDLYRDLLARSVLRACIDVSVTEDGVLIGGPKTLQSTGTFLDHHFSMEVQGSHVSNACIALRTDWKISRLASVRELSSMQTLEQILPLALEESTRSGVQGKCPLPLFVFDRLLQGCCDGEISFCIPG